MPTENTTPNTQPSPAKAAAQAAFAASIKPVSGIVGLAALAGAAYASGDTGLGQGIVHYGGILASGVAVMSTIHAGANAVKAWKNPEGHDGQSWAEHAKNAAKDGAYFAGAAVVGALAYAAGRLGVSEVASFSNSGRAFGSNYVNDGLAAAGVLTAMGTSLATSIVGIAGVCVSSAAAVLGADPKETLAKVIGQNFADKLLQRRQDNSQQPPESTGGFAKPSV